MSDFSSPHGWTPEDIKEFVTLLAILEDPSFEPCEWEPSRQLVNGSWTMPYPIYGETIEQVRALASKAWLHPYELLPGDPENIDLFQFLFTPEYFNTATMEQVRRYFALISRRERFCDGYIAGEVKNGVMCAAIRRAAQLAGQL